SGLTISSGGSTVRGLAINRFTANGIVLQTGGNNRIEGCRIGTDALGMTGSGNAVNGVLIQSGSSNSVIGGITSRPGNLPGNVISGNGSSSLQAGVTINGSATTGNVVEGNLIGLAADGSTLLGNREGVLLGSAGSPTGN